RVRAIGAAEGTAMGQLGEEPKRLMQHRGTLEARMIRRVVGDFITTPEASCRPSRATARSHPRENAEDRVLRERGKGAGGGAEAEGLGFAQAWQARNLIDLRAGEGLGRVRRPPMPIGMSGSDSSTAKSLPPPPNLGRGRSIAPFRTDAAGRIRTRPVN